MTPRTALRALKAGSLAVADLASEPRLGRVDSAYRRAINVVHGDGSLVCLHPEGIPLHPYAVIMGGEAPSTGADSAFLGIRLGDRALVSADCIDFVDPGPSVLLGEAEVWDSRLCPLSPGGTERAFKMRHVLWHVALEGGVASPFLGAMAEARGHKTVTAPDAAAGGIDALMRERAKNLMQGMTLALQSGLAGSWRPLLGELVGFGPGLTPSGDDFLLGLLAASHAFQSDQRDAIEVDVAALVADGAQATVRQSQYMLNAALKGHFPEPVIDLLVALGQSISEDVRKAARRLRSLGSASGQDMLAGILFRLDTCRKPALSGAV